MTYLVDNFNRAKMAFIMNQPPPGDLVCRMNRKTITLLVNDIDMGSGTEVRCLGPADLPAVPPDVCGFVCGVMVVPDESQADGEFAFSVRMPGMPCIPVLEFARWMPVDCSGPVKKLEEALVPVLMTFGPTFSSADAIQGRLDQLADLVMLPDPEFKPAKLTAWAV